MMDKKIVYIAHPISDTRPEDLEWIKPSRLLLEANGTIQTVDAGDREHFHNTKGALEEAKTVHYLHGVARRLWPMDRWDVKRADVVLAVLLGAKKMSLGVAMEVAVAECPVVLVIESDGSNPNEHALLLQAATVVTDSLPEALDLCYEFLK